MQTVSATRRIKASQNAIWSLIADVRRIADWHYNIATVDLLSSAPTGIGAARRCNFHDGSNVREDVVAVTEEQRILMKLSEFSVPMKRLELEITLRRLAAEETEAVLTLRYVVKYGILGRILGATVVRKELTGVTTKLLAGLDLHATTGTIIDKDTLLQAA